MELKDFVSRWILASCHNDRLLEELNANTERRVIDLEIEAAIDAWRTIEAACDEVGTNTHRVR